MALTVVTTPGASDANSYADAADFAAYLATRPQSWPDTLAVSDDAEEIKRALLTATRLLDEELFWDGWAVSSDQVLQFPRSGLLTPTGFALPSDSIPDRLRDATCELAIQVMAENRTLDAAADVQGLKSLKAGPVALEFRASVGTKPIPDRVEQMVSLWLVGEGLRGTIPLVRV